MISTSNFDQVIKNFIRNTARELYSLSYWSVLWNKVFVDKKGNYLHKNLFPYEKVDITYLFEDDGFTIKVKLQPKVKTNFFKKLKKAILAQELSS